MGLKIELIFPLTDEEKAVISRMISDGEPVRKEEPKAEEKAIMPSHPIKVGSKKELIYNHLKKSNGLGVTGLILALGIDEQVIRNTLASLQRDKKVVKSSTRPLVYYADENEDLKDALVGSKVSVMG